MKEFRIRELEIAQAVLPPKDWDISVIHLFLGRWDIPRDWDLCYRDMSNGDWVFVKKKIEEATK